MQREKGKGWRRMESAGEWLEKALVSLCSRSDNSLDFDADLISGLVSYCQFASPLDAKEYLDVRYYYYYFFLITVLSSLLSTFNPSIISTFNFNTT